MALPLTREGFVVKSLNGSQSQWPRDSGDVFPFLVTLQNLDGDGARKLLVDATVLFDLPHAVLCIYHVWYVKRDNGLVMHNVRAKRVTMASHQARDGENVPRTARPGLVACRWRPA